MQFISLLQIKESQMIFQKSKNIQHLIQLYLTGRYNKYVELSEFLTQLVKIQQSDFKRVKRSI